jgi:hypothetical protein
MGRDSTSYSQSTQPRSSASHVSVHYSELPQELGGDADDAVALFAARANGVCDGIDYPALVTLGRLDKAVRRVQHAAHLVLVAARSGRTDVSDSLEFLGTTGTAWTADLWMGDRSLPSVGPTTRRSREDEAAPHPDGRRGHRRQRSSWRSRQPHDDGSDASAQEGESAVDAAMTLSPQKSREIRRRRDKDRSVNSSEFETEVAAQATVTSNIAQLEAAARAIYQTLPWQLRQRFDVEAAFLPSRSLTGVYE